MTKELSKKMLEDLGVQIFQTSDNDYAVFHKGRKVKIGITTTKHKYGKDMYYHTLHFRLNKKVNTYHLCRILYAYFIGTVPAGYDVDHIDNNPLNDSLSNLQILTRRENLLKRGRGHNQHNCKWTPKEESERKWFLDQIKYNRELLRGLRAKLKTNISQEEKDGLSRRYKILRKETERLCNMYCSNFGVKQV